LAAKFFGDKNDNSSPCLERWIFLFGKNVELPNQTILLELPNKGSIKVDSPTNTLFWIHPNTRGNHFNQRIRNPTQEIGVATSPPLKVAYRVIGHIPDPGVPGRDIVIIEETISGDIGRAVLQGPIWGKSQDTATAQKSLALEYEWTGLQR
jgi:hypothetical protein